MNNKKGSSAVFLTVILAALMSITLALIYGVKAEAIRSSTDAVINLAGDSVLSEFDRQLQEEYGLFLIKGTDKELSQKLYRYISYSLADMDDVSIDSVNVSAAGYSIVNTELIKAQILEHMKVLEAEKIITDHTDGSSEVQTEERSLKHGPTIASLPSSTLPDKSLTATAEALADKTSEVDKVFKAGTDTYLINGYVFEIFNSRVHVADSGHFFRSEVEYILGGELSDKKNEKRVEIALKAMRFPINMAHLYSDSEKQAALMTAAELLTPGATAPVTQAALASTWAYAESDNDVELLWQGHKVPMVKDSNTWAIELDSAIEGIFGGTVMPAQEKGYDYEAYLQILMFFQDENIKFSRILDLIQINMRAEYDRDFLINEYSAGISVEVKANGRTYRHEKKY